tara:strand:- start:3847 stop:4911 length:1065 start_codon:yes stop_codon:yes gene_type:complete
MKILVTGGYGFIGSALIRHILDNTNFSVLNIDKLTYAGNIESIPGSSGNLRYLYKNIDICDKESLKKIFNEYKPSIVMHLAAESHVDRSIESPDDFINTNIIGTFNLLEEAYFYFKSISDECKEIFRFHHISTDEVYGDLKGTKDLFTEETSYDPSSPYSASKASSDHLVRAWHRTYGLPVIITNCSNNYGPYHFPEKLIPHIILSAIKGKNLSVYGDGSQIRDWLYVEDHVKALLKVVTKGKIGETYNIGGHNEIKNIKVVEMICALLEELAPEKKAGFNKYTDLIKFVKDRPGHDARYAIDATKINKELDWVPIENFESGLRKTVIWYLNNENWWERVLSNEYRLERKGEQR